MFEFLRSIPDRLKPNQYFSVTEALDWFQNDPGITLDLPKSLPQVYTYDQLNGVPPLGIHSLVFQLIDGGRDHTGRNSHFMIRVTFANEYQYIDVEDNGPGIKDLPTLRSNLKYGSGSHWGSSLELACVATNALGGAIIPSNLTNETGEISGARFRIQLPLDRNKMNMEHSRHLRESLLSG